MKVVAKTTSVSVRLAKRALILTLPAIAALPVGDADAKDSGPIRSFAESPTSSLTSSKPQNRSAQAKKRARLKMSRLKQSKTFASQNTTKIQREIMSGFDPSVDGFNFANWFGPATPEEDSLSQLIALFGTSSICSQQSTPTNCQPFSSAEAFAASMNQLITEGRCEGIVVLASKMFKDHRTGISSKRAIELDKSEVLGEISYWWATQVLPKVSTESARTRSKQPSALIDQIAAGILNGATSSLGIYFEGKGHTLLPIGFRQNGSTVIVDVYDSNTPRLTQHLIIDSNSESWSYKSADENSNILMQWSGIGSGGLDVIAIDSRKPQLTSFFEKN